MPTRYTFFYNLS